MKKALLLNGPVSRVIATLGHGDSLCIADAGLPIPPAVERIDLAVRAGLPSFLDTLEAVTSEMQVERALCACELAQRQPTLQSGLEATLATTASSQGAAVALDSVDHEGFKARTHACRAVIRTGECSPFANVILYAGVTF